MKLTKLQSKALTFFVEVELKQTLKSDFNAFQDAMPSNYSNSCHRLNILGLIDHDNKLTDLGNSAYFSIEDDQGNEPTVEQAIEWSESEESTLYVMDTFNVFSIDSPEFARIESVMAEMIHSQPEVNQKPKFKRGQVVMHTELNWRDAVVVSDHTYKLNRERVIRVNLDGHRYEWNPKHVAVQSERVSIADQFAIAGEPLADNEG